MLNINLPFNITTIPEEYIHPGGFGTIRKNDIHTGIDFYCEPDTIVFSITDGYVVDIQRFTGASVGSPWWNETDCVIVRDLDDNYIVYGEINATCELGQIISKGDLIGTVIPVLKVDKGLPMTMLHLEYYDHTFDLNPVIWNLNSPKPDSLLNPIILFK